MSCQWRCFKIWFSVAASAKPLGYLCCLTLLDVACDRSAATFASVKRVVICYRYFRYYVHFMLSIKVRDVCHTMLGSNNTI